MAHDFDHDAPTWDDKPERLERSHRVAAAMRPLIPAGHPRTVELGAGTGMLSRCLAEHLGHVVLLDASPGMVEVARRETRAHGWEARVADLTDGEIDGGPYDLVLSQLAMHHIPDVSALLTRVHRCLVPGGRLLVADLDHDAEGHYHAHVDGFDGHHGFHRGEFAIWLEAAGFTAVEFHDVGNIGKEVEGHRQDFPLFLAAATA
ncbi:methyltransferase domain-containing protein [Arachnia propionica]|uniref:Methyltransferase domain-containing protein n=1 Tax=Arachnia propionica TaxID=1750 RepID=A0A3P1TAS3_9ACTN|nr:class I SAM-dependent methyltransferase [Arachnia propionica]MDO5082769.1 methyltransferase domain-containing protein [Arachnia propionica]RRD05966.1 methyltransferase domain-containing protein [Arachnia propionica]